MRHASGSVLVASGSLRTVAGPSCAMAGLALASIAAARQIKARIAPCSSVRGMKLNPTFLTRN
jgi:hypothetical protein